MKNILEVRSLGSLVNKDQVIFNLKATKKQAAIKELVHKLCELGMLDGEAMVIRRVMDREKLESTGLGKGIAFPHARVEVGDMPLLAIGRSAKGIDFESIDGQPVHIMVLVLWQPSVSGLFNQLFGGLARQFSDHAFVDALAGADSAEKMFKIVRDIPFQMTDSDVNLSKSMLLLKLQDMELKKAETKQKKEQGELQKQIDLIREDLGRDILWRFDKLLERDGVAVVKLENGTCQGCFLRLSSGFCSTVLNNPHNIYVCERCGKYLSI